MTVDYVALALEQSHEDAGGCWVFGGYLVVGYGQVGRNLRAHRVVWEHFNGPVPDGLQLDHLCRNRACCNPWHLEPVTPRVNILRGVSCAARNAVKEVCAQGHPLTGSNVYQRPDRFGRMCRICRKVADDKNRPKRLSDLRRDSRVWRERNWALHDAGELCRLAKCARCRPYRQKAA